MQNQIQTQTSGVLIPPIDITNYPDTRRHFLVEARHINNAGVLEFYVKHYHTEEEARQFAVDYPKIIGVTEAGSHPSAHVFEVMRIV